MSGSTAAAGAGAGAAAARATAVGTAGEPMAGDAGEPMAGDADEPRAGVVGNGEPSPAWALSWAVVVAVGGSSGVTLGVAWDGVGATTSGAAGDGETIAAAGG